MAGWGFWEWLGYICMGIAAIVLAVDQTAKGSPTMREALSGLLGNPLWNYAPAVLIAVSAIVIIANQVGWVGSRGQQQPSPVASKLGFTKTGLRLQFFGDYRIPQQVSADNIAAWFAYYSPSMKLTPHDAKGDPMPGGLEIPPSWAIFVVIDRPTAFKQVISTFSNPEIAPPIEVRANTTRHIVVTSKSQFPAGVLDIHVED